MPFACPLQITTTGGAMGQGTSAHWEADAPSGLTIVAAGVSLSSNYINDGSNGQYGGGFYWDGGGGSQINPGESIFFTPPGFSSSTFGFFVVCGLSTCDQYGGNITLYSASFVVSESAPPTISGSWYGLWAATGWVRGVWPLLWSANSASGVCSLTASLAGQALPNETVTPNDDEWQQCQIPYGQWLGDTVYTNEYPNGIDTLQIGASDAAGESSSASEKVHIDNQLPTVALSGPTDAPSTAGTQYVTATAAAGPSGVYGIDCTVDGGPGQWYQAATARVPVNGVGEHIVRCYSENNAVTMTGVRAVSATESFETKIGVPTVTAIAFDRLVDKLRCHRVHARHRSKTVTKCHPRTKLVRRKVTVTVRRHGRRAHVRRTKKVRVVVLPHVVASTQRVVGHGKATTVNGWLGLNTGAALAGQSVEVLAAPDNGSTDFTPVATTTTLADGSWSATVPPGPSRVIEASYGGAATTEASLSAVVHEIVPAKVELVSVTPRKVAWGQKVRIVGRLVGGYLPHGGALVRLRIGIGSAHTTYGVHEHVAGNGRFKTSYTFGVGSPSEYRSYWFQIASLPMGDYPYAPSNSRKLSVLVGGHPG